jgi:uncharacterized iron-regulated membrane protein
MHVNNSTLHPVRVRVGRKGSTWWAEIHQMSGASSCVEIVLFANPTLLWQIAHAIELGVDALLEDLRGETHEVECPGTGCSEE